MLLTPPQPLKPFQPRSITSAAIDQFRLAICLLLAFSVYRQAISQSRCPLDTQPEDSPRVFSIGGGSVALPIGAFLLIRQADAIGALRLTSLSHDTTVQPRNKEWIGLVNYESYYMTRTNDSLAAASASKQSGQLAWGRYKGVGFHYSWQPGNHIALVGPWRFMFSGQSWMAMSTFSKWNGVQDRGFEFAPTSACELREIDLHDPKLKWFHYDRNFNSTDFPLTDLGK